ncbi:retrovirus-related pol polyprotein from transposon TNT 1-94 [Tanacetum coccineum]
MRVLEEVSGSSRSLVAIWILDHDFQQIVQNNSVVETSDLQAELDRTKEKMKTSYNDMQNQIEQLQAQLGDLKGKSMNTLCASDTLDPLPQDNIVKNDKVITPGMFRINPSKTSWVDNVMPNKPIKASIRKKPITTLQPHVITLENVNSNSNGLSSTRVESTANTRRPPPRRNTKNDRVPSASKNICIKNKDVEVEEHHRNLLLWKTQKHMSSKCNNIKLAISNDKSEVVCAMCKKCLITTNHDVCVFNYMKDMNSYVDNHSANVSKSANHKKHMPKVKKPKKSWSKESLATPKPRKPRTCLNSKGIVRFRNDYVAVIMGYGDLQWGDILIARVYYVDGLGYNLFSVGQFCDSDLKSWLWHQRLSHLSFHTINDLAKNDLITGLPKFKYHKEHLCPSCEQGKRKKASHPPKPVPNSKQRSKDEAPVIIVRTDNDTKFKKPNASRGC